MVGGFPRRSPNLAVSRGRHGRAAREIPGDQTQVRAGDLFAIGEKYTICLVSMPVGLALIVSNAAPVGSCRLLSAL